MISVHGWEYGDIDQSPSFTYLLEHRSDPEIKPLFALAVGKRPSEELYDIVNDPACLNNLAGQKEYSREVRRLSGVLDRYLAKTKDPRMLTGESAWDHFPYYFRK